ncbi:delta and Notch-like epidermal growth factor-related receptor [Dioscorea cayenensis subsp. rotundata]|uniref:Delta and Notch-like epidermal growth factor-related receptor n=1 Tax=Dioscorea cayennensis subsp. rotundata TaxID=55577 RepID=A0AB40AII7_DIOCR|nr:delta and Notch-like epidermal growth factor-related receptor [Dioscorea cayenensis subsp. rotundata]
MGAAKVLVILVAIIQLVSPWMGLTTASGADAFAPFLSPFTNGLCDGVDCGKGTCKTSESHLFGFTCECNQGWTQFHIGDHFRFLPCNIPNCTVDYSCSKDIAPTAAPPESTPSNLSLFDPCLWSTCGGGECRKTGAYDHKCDCKAGYSNLLNISSFPCLKECSLTGDCAKLGITLSNSTSSNTTDNSSSSGTNSASFRSKNLVWLFIILTSLVMVRAA